MPVVIDVPHLRERTCNDSTTATLVLTVDNFQTSDDGIYQCMAMDGNTTGEGGSIELRGIEIVYHICTMAPLNYSYNFTSYHGYTR